MDIGGWLRSLGLERHAAAFRENAIDEFRSVLEMALSLEGLEWTLK